MSRKRMAIILASASPRRREFFSQLGLRFRVVAPHIEEDPLPGEPPVAYARRVAVDKAIEVAGQVHPKAVIVAADTIVVLGRRILQKPADAEDARRMLRALSGRRHEVITGVCILGPRRMRTLVARTQVFFKKLTAAEIDFYVESGEPMDKAGAYAIQGKGCFMVRAVRGSYTNVVGLPVAELLDTLVADFAFSI